MTISSVSSSTVVAGGSRVRFPDEQFAGERPERKEAVGQRVEPRVAGIAARIGGRLPHPIGRARGT